MEMTSEVSPIATGPPIKPGAFPEATSARFVPDTIDTLDLTPIFAHFTIKIAWTIVPSRDYLCPGNRLPG
jgi:hypothetical protein